MPSDRWLRAAPLAIAVSVSIGWSLAMRPPSAHATPPPVGTGGQGQAVYLRDCAVCHGADAGGSSRGPSLQRVGAAAVDFWVSSGRMPLVEQGRPAPSPYDTAPPGQAPTNPDLTPARHQPAYPPDVIAALVAYVDSIAPGGPAIPSVDTAHADLAAGGELYRLQCAACHSWDGTGGALYQRQAPSIHASTPTQVAEAVRTGPGQMPAFGVSAIPDDQLNDVVSYVRYLDHPNDRGGFSLWHLGPVAEGGVAIIGGLGALLLLARWIGERS